MKIEKFRNFEVQGQESYLVRRGGDRCIKSLRFSGSMLFPGCLEASVLGLATCVAVVEYRSDDTCLYANNGYCYDGGPNQYRRQGVYCTLGTDATDCGTPPAPPPLTGTIEATVDDQGRASRTTEGSFRFGSPVFSVTSGRQCANIDHNYDNGNNPTYGTCLEWDDTPPSPR